MTLINIENVAKKYGKQKVLDTINLKFEAQQSVALIGPNGSGKTTLIKSILGLVIPDNGQIKVENQITTKSPAYRKNIGYMPQLSLFPTQMKVKQLFELIKGIRTDTSKSQYDTSLYEEFEISKMENKALGTLSGGMKQQVSASLAFYFCPKIIILDEPTAGLDPLSNEILKAKINQTVTENRLLLTTSHILSDLDEICNHVVYLMNGQIVLDKPMHEMQSLTGETRLNKIIVKFLKNNISDEQN